MDTSVFLSTRKRWLAALFAGFALLLAGCDIKVTNLTPSSLKANPSSVYTISTQINKSATSAVMDGTIRPEVIIDGASFPMKLAPGSEKLYEFDYRMPSGRSSATYYILVKYDVRGNDQIYTREYVGKLSTINVETRYSVELEVDRAPVGAKVAILGRGFVSSDRVTVGGVAASSQLQNGYTLTFTVPNLPDGRNYPVKVAGATGELFVGTLRIDGNSALSAIAAAGSSSNAPSGGAIRVTPGSISLGAGQSLPVIFSIPSPAPAGGLSVRVTTDVPRSVIMEPVTIQAGLQSTSIKITGGQSGSGSLYVEAPGFPEVVIPISVQ